MVTSNPKITSDQYLMSSLDIAHVQLFLQSMPCKQKITQPIVTLLGNGDDNDKSAWNLLISHISD